MLLSARRRVLLWVGWPLAVLVLGVGLPHFTRYWYGWGFEWLREAPDRWQLVQIVWVMLLPPLFVEILSRTGRNNG